MMHYAAGSKWNNEFWDFATERGSLAMEEAMSHSFFNDLYTKGEPSNDTSYRPYFGAESYKLNLEGLGLECSVTPDWHHTQNECIIAQAAE
jgi:hypothetical protein